MEVKSRLSVAVSQRRGVGCSTPSPHLRLPLTPKTNRRVQERTDPRAVCVHLRVQCGSDCYSAVMRSCCVWNKFERTGARDDSHPFQVALISSCWLTLLSHARLPRAWQLFFPLQNARRGNKVSSLSLLILSTVFNFITRLLLVWGWGSLCRRRWQHGDPHWKSLSYL